VATSTIIIMFVSARKVITAVWWPG